MKKITIILTIFLIIQGCKSDTDSICPPLVLEFKFDDESIDQIPPAYSKTEVLVFINEEGQKKEFTGIKNQFLDGVWASLAICDGDTSRQVRTTYETISIHYESIDSVNLSFELGMFPSSCNSEEIGYENPGNYISASMIDNKTKFITTSGGVHRGSIGLISKIVKFPEGHESSDCYQHFQELQSVVLVGKEYFDVLYGSYSWDLTRYMYFKEGLGIIGFVDTDGVTWRIES